MPWIGNFNVAEVLFSKYILLVFFFLIQLEFFFFICYSNIILVTKLTKIIQFNQVLTNFSIKNTNFTYLLLTLFLFLFFKIKSFHIDHLVIICLYLLYTLNSFLEKVNYKSVTINIIYIIIPTIFYFIFFLILSDSFLVLFFFVELYGVLYYFCFLTSYNFTNQTILKYKNGLLLLLWNNFLTTVFMSLGCFFFLKNYGTTSFVELSLLPMYNLSVYFFLVGFFWKLGLPSFHFFKLEVYRFLLKENVLLFSIITTLINFFLFFFLFSINLVFSFIYFEKILLTIFISSITLIIVNLKLINFLQFFAFSGVFTLTTISTVFLI
jgi:hypothetical protein